MMNCIDLKNFIGTITIILYSFWLGIICNLFVGNKVTSGTAVYVYIII